MIRTMSEIDVKQGLRLILEKIEAAKLRRPPELQCVAPRLVAVSKTKPANLIVAVYEEGQTDFGENYVQELEAKATDSLILENCKDIRWHFIGHLQTNKINKVLAVPNLHMIETVDSEKLAVTLNKRWPEFRAAEERLNVMIQVNTSGEKDKSGIYPDDVNSLAKFILENCENLHLDGLMTIGELGRIAEEGPNPDFACLRNCRDLLCKDMGLDWARINLSMGMSGDFEQAIQMGSSNVRVGSSIFGYRPKKNDD